jgi:hypothetical protein
VRSFSQNAFRALLGFVELKDNPHHRSAKLVVMTAKGVQAYDAALRAQAPRVNMLGEGCDPKSIEEAARLLSMRYDSGLSIPHPIVPTAASKSPPNT